MAELIDTLEILISENPSGFTEHQLLTRLQKAPHHFFAEDALHDPLILFQTHFLLFHCLYLLQQRWRKNHFGDLEISALSIVKCPHRPRDKRLDVEKSTHRGHSHTLNIGDPLAQYYLDWSHFSSTSRDDVDELLNRFWKKVFIPVEESLQDALSIFELDSPIPTPALKAQYRRLAQRYHPDKGGDSERFKKISQAFHQLKQYNLALHS